MSSRPEASGGRIARAVRLVLLGAVAAYATWNSVAVSRHLLQVTSIYGVTVDPPAAAPGSPTGYEGGRRSLVLPAAASDTAHWVMQTQEMAARGTLRLRHVDYDDAPDGRDVHWAAPAHWWLGTLAWLDHLLTGRDAGLAIERAALTAGPAMLALFLAVLVPLLHRRFSPTAAVLAAAGAVTTYPFFIDFSPGDAGHHAPVNLCCLASVLCLLIGGQAAEGADPADRTAIRAARRWFAGSAAAAGVGLWISAATQAPVLIGTGLGLLAATWLGRAAPGRLAWIRDPSLLRRWGLVGGGVSLAAYLLEYFPSHLGFRLEVNHPLYAVAWAGAGEALSLGSRAICGGLRSLDRGERRRGAGAIALVALLPVVIALTSPATFVVADPFVWHLHADYIAEFQGLAALLHSSHFSANLASILPPMLLLVPPLTLVFRQDLPPASRAQAALATTPALLALVLGWMQVRWLGLAFALTLPPLALFFRVLEREPPASRRLRPAAWALVCGLLLVPGAVMAVRRTSRSGEFTRDEIRLLAQRDVAQWLRLRAGDSRVVVASAPNSTSKLIYHGGLAGLGTLYWENAEGLKHAAALFAAPSAEAAHELVRRWGVTHVVYFSWDPFAFTMTKLARGLPPAAPLPADAFIVRLLASPVPPPWLEAVPFEIPPHSAIEGDQIRIWRVVPEQSPADATAHAASCALELGEAGRARQLGAALAAFPADLNARVMAAAVAAADRNSAAFSRELERVTALLPRASGLSLEDRLHLVVVLAVGNRLDAARSQLRLCMAAANDSDLRHLTPGTLSDFLSLANALGVDFPDPALRRLAERLLPPIRRK